MAIVTRELGESQSPKQKTPTQRTASGALSVDVDIRLKGSGLVITRSQVAMALVALVTLLGWILKR